MRLLIVSSGIISGLMLIVGYFMWVQSNVPFALSPASLFTWGFNTGCLCLLLAVLKMVIEDI